MARRSRRLVPVAAFALVVGNLGSAAPARAAATLNVPADYATIQAAINAAAPGDTVLVDDGTYHERLTISSAITVKSVNGAGLTAIDGDALGTDVSIAAGTLHGFTIQHGAGSLTSPSAVDASGGAIVEDNVIADNTACPSSLHFRVTGSATVQRNTFTRNGDSTCGGGVLGFNGPSDALVAHNTFEDNAVIAIEIDNGGGPTIDANVIRNNGGGLLIINDSRPTVTNNLVVDSAHPSSNAIRWQTTSTGSGPVVENNTLIVASNEPGVTLLTADGTGSFANNIVVGTGSYPLVQCYAMQPTVAYNDLWANGAPIQDGSCLSSGNKSGDPRFVDPASGNYHLRPDSGIIDGGANGLAPAKDFDGDSRPYDGNGNGVAAVDPGFDEATDLLLASPPSISFPSTGVGATSAASVVTVRNYGAEPLTISGLSIHGANNLNFLITGETCTGAPLVHASCTVNVAFKPNAIGSRVGELDITGPGKVGIRRVALAGTGLDPIQITPPSIDFGSIVVGAKSAATTVTVTYIGGPSATVTSATVGGSNAADFVITGQTCVNVPLSTNATCTISVQFGPKAVGSRVATLTISGPAPVGTRHVNLTGTATQPASGVVWGTLSLAGPAYTWNFGSSLARTVLSGTQYLHLAFNTDRVGGKWATDTGPYVGAYYVRSGSGTTWSTPFRLNSSTTHATNVGLAASGSHVYAVWETQTKWVNFSNTAPRILYVRVNTNHGSSTAWKTAVRLSSTTGRVGFPTIAAAGNDVYIAWTNAVGGTMELTISHDAGATWKTIPLGTTTQSSARGYSGDPSVAASGSTVAVVWRRDAAGSVGVRISTDKGATFSAATTIGTSIGVGNVAVRGSRVAVAWPTLDDVVLRQRISGVWSAPVIAAHLQTGAPTLPYATAVALQDPNRVGIAWAETLNDTQAQLRWAESSNGGGIWYQTQTPGALGPAHQVNDWPSVIWPTAGTRMVTWNGWTGNTTDYRQYFRSGTGTPTGTTTLAVPWTAGVTSAETGPDAGWRFAGSRLEPSSLPPRS